MGSATEAPFSMQEIQFERFAHAAPPEPGGNPGTYEERLAQWFLEGTFFRDFVHRNPRGKGGKGELADAVVLYGDVALMVQVKAQSSTRDPCAWASKHIAKAANQLRGTYRMLIEQHVKELYSETLGPMPFDPDKYRYKHGLIIVAHESPPYDASELCNGITTFSFPVHVLSLQDFLTLSDRLDTAGDLISYLDLRYELRQELPLIVHQEANTARCMRAGYARVLVEQGHEKGLAEATAAAFDEQLEGELQRSEDYRFSLLVDDIIARLHTNDPALPWASDIDPRHIGAIAEQLAWLPRRKRMAIGERLFSIVSAAKDGKDHLYHCLSKSRRVTYIFFATSRPRSDRVEQLRLLVEAARVRYDVPTGVGVATNPIGWGGRAYDVTMQEGEIDPELRAKLVGVLS